MRDLDRVIGALKSPVRREILSLVWDEERAMGEIAAFFELTKPTISQHLSVLRRAGLVGVTAVGTSRRYRARPEALAGLGGALEAATKWTTADDLPERDLAGAVTRPSVVAEVDVPTEQAVTFTAFTEPEIYSRWLGVPVSLRDGRFACRLEWGTQVRGRYEVVCPPELIAMRWDFEDDNVPVPGGEMTAYLRLAPRDGGTHVEVHQLVATEEEARFMEVAWSMVLGRLAEGVERAVDSQAAVAPRARRHKRRE